MTIKTSILNFIKNYFVVVAIAILLSILISQSGILIPAALLGIASVFVVFFKMIKDIRWGFYVLLAANFMSNGLTRYVPLTLGLVIDILLLLLFFMYFIKEFKNITWKPLANPVFIAVSIWMMINVFEIANPEARSFEAWFYAMRGVALYFCFTLLIGYLCLNYKTDFNWFITFWFLFSIFGTLWGMKQLYIGLDSGEKTWLAVPGNLSTHMLFGRLRVFSFYSDGGQFGASQAHTSVVAAILAIFEKSRKRKIFYIITFLLCFYGMIISGTRGAFAIPIVGFFTYLVLIRNFKIIIVGVSILAIAFYILKFTFIGQSIPQVGRLRSSLNPNDASLQVRISNQKKLASYLNVHYLGGGVGSGGYWGQRFSPNTFLANLALDSWYVRIAAEYGYVGLVLYILMLLFITLYAYKKINSEVDLIKKNHLIALFCGLTGILVASYGNQVFGQSPTGILIYLSIVFLTQNEPEDKLIHAK